MLHIATERYSVDVGIQPRNFVWKKNRKLHCVSKKAYHPTTCRWQAVKMICRFDAYHACGVRTDGRTDG